MAFDKKGINLKGWVLLHKFIIFVNEKEYLKQIKLYI